MIWVNCRLMIVRDVLLIIKNNDMKSNRLLYFTI
jgi:hypothetical protein